MSGQSAAYSRYCTFIVRNNTYRRLLQRPNLSLLLAKYKVPDSNYLIRNGNSQRLDVFSLIKFNN